jgi:hypothetical protein
MVLRCLVPPSPRTSLRSLDDAETKREPRGREEAAIDIVFIFRPDEEIIFIRRFCLRVQYNQARLVWVLKFNKHCSTFVLFDKKFLILD